MYCHGHLRVINYECKSINVLKVKIIELMNNSEIRIHF